MTHSEHVSALEDYDLAKIRSDFPILSRSVYGKPLVYLDNGASAQKPQAVIDAVSQCYSQTYANVHRGLHFLSNEATDLYEAARESVRHFLNAKAVQSIVFTRSSTEAINLVASSYGNLVLKQGDEVIISLLEHHSNIVPWHFLRERLGIKLKWVPVDEDGNFLMEDFEAMLTERTKIVSVTHMSNALGTIVPVKAVIEKAHAIGARVLIDGSQGAVHLPVDVQDLDVDFYAITGHKLYGPSGIGALYAKPELLESMPPFMGGGEMISDVRMDSVSYAEPPHKFEAGTPPIAQAIGLGVALGYLEAIGREKIVRHEADLCAYANQRLSAINSLQILGKGREKGAIFSFVMDNAHAQDISMLIDRSGVAVRAGTHCAQPLLDRFGVSATCRASFGLYNSRREIDVLVEALNKAQSFFV